MDLGHYLPNNPNDFYNSEKEVYTFYIPRDLLGVVERELKKQNIEKLKLGKTETLNLSSFIEDIFISWVYSHTQLEGLDSYDDISKSNDKVKVTLYLHKTVISLIKLIAVECSASASLVISNALVWWVDTHM